MKFSGEPSAPSSCKGGTQPCHRCHFHRVSQHALTLPTNPPTLHEFHHLRQNQNQVSSKLSVEIGSESVEVSRESVKVQRESVEVRRESVELQRESVELQRESASYISSAMYSTYARPERRR